jgi:hypothetical protein
MMVNFKYLCLFMNFILNAFSFLELIIILYFEDFFGYFINLFIVKFLINLRIFICNRFFRFLNYLKMH